MQKCRRCGQEFTPQNFHLALGVCHGCIKPSDVGLQEMISLLAAAYEVAKTIARIDDVPVTSTSYTIPGLWAPQPAIGSEENALRAEVACYRKALDRIIADDDCDPVQVAHEAITPYTRWGPISPEESAAIDRAAGISAHNVTPAAKEKTP